MSTVDRHVVRHPAARFAVVVALASVLGLVLTARVFAADPRDQVAEVALTYAQGFESLLAAEPAEAEKLGVDRATLATLTVTGVHRVKGLDEGFMTKGDTRGLDQAIVDTDLWWVVLSAKDGARLVVSVSWADGAGAPEASGLNWVDAHDLTAALDASKGADRAIVWVPQDLPLVLSGTGADRKAVPVVSADVARQLRVGTGSMSVGEYSKALHRRIDSLKVEADSKAEGLAGGVGALPSGTSTARSVEDGPPLPVPLLAAAVFVVVVVATLWRSARKGHAL